MPVVNISKLWEKAYPFLIALVVVVAIRITKINYAASNNLNDALTAIITVSSLIIGFLGAILPVIMSMKNDSKMVKYVFEKDTDKLFLKYIKHTMITGIMVILVAIILFFRDQFSETHFYTWCIEVAGYTVACFLLCTYRCLNNMLNLIFADDKQLFQDEGFIYKSKREKEFESKAPKD